MASVLYIDTQSDLTSGSEVLIPINPMQPRGMVKNQPVTIFETITGPGGMQAPKDWYPIILFSWPDIVQGNTNHDALLSMFETRQYVKTGLDYYIGIKDAVAKDDGFPFPTSNKYIKIRIIEVKAPENPEDNDMNAVISNMVVTAKWMDAS